LHKVLHTKIPAVADSLKKPKSKTRAAENLSARVYNQIKTLILCNEILPGQKLHHQQLSERLGVSRTPVREALTRLVQEGYVSFLPNRGFTCKEIRMQEAEELYELREALEAFAVEKAIAHLTDTALARLRAKINSYGHDVKNRFTRERLVYDQDVHLAIAELAGNQTLKNMLRHVFERIVLKRRTDGLYDPARGVTPKRLPSCVITSRRDRRTLWPISNSDRRFAVAEQSPTIQHKQKQRRKEKSWQQI
jgi:DNA-binding GntR family transcriptional regulator